MPLSPVIARNRQAIVDIARRYNARNVKVFGSMARGDADDNSDVDLLVDFSADTSLLDRIALAQEIEKLLGRKIDLVSADKLHKLIRKSVLEESIPL